MTIPAGNVIRWAAAALLAVAASGPALAASAAPSVFQPSRITFKAEYRGITAGTITISLLDAGQGNYIYESRANAGGLARLIVHHEIREASTFTLENNQIRPLAYVLDDGSPDTAKDTRLEFDWKAVRMEFKKLLWDRLESPNGTVEEFKKPGNIMRKNQLDQ